MSTTTTTALPIPMRDQVVNADSGRFSRTWTNYIDDLNSTVAANSAAIAAKAGVTDGSDATAGQIGEYVRHDSPSAIALPNGTPTNVATMPLAPGDWDVFGNARFTATGAMTNATAGISTATGTWNSFVQAIPGTLGTGTVAVIGTGGPVRVNVAALTTVYLVCGTSFSSGGVTATGSIFARRAR